MVITLWILQQLAGAIIGILVTALVPIMVTGWRYRKRKELLGDWKSAYQGIDEPINTWVSEDVTISVKFGKFRFKNKNNSHGYDYLAVGKLLAKQYFVGEWESKRPGGNAFGVFCLTVSARGDCLYGYWFGPTKSGTRRYGRWVLARAFKTNANGETSISLGIDPAASLRSLEEGKKLAERMAKPEPQDE